MAAMELKANNKVEMMKITPPQRKGSLRDAWLGARSSNSILQLRREHGDQAVTRKEHSESLKGEVTDLTSQVRRVEELHCTSP